MVIEGSSLLNYSILSLHTANEIGRVKTLIIDPNYLKIVAFEIDGNGVIGDNKYLEVQSVREISKMGMIIDSIDELISHDDVVKLGEIIDLGFVMFGMKVVSRKKHLLGRVEDFIVTTDTFQIMQMIVKRPTLKSFIDPELVIGRSEIYEINDSQIIVKSEENKIREKSSTKDFVPNFINPFRNGKYIAPNSDFMNDGDS